MLWCYCVKIIREINCCEILLILHSLKLFTITVVVDLLHMSFDNNISQYVTDNRVILHKTGDLLTHLDFKRT